MVRAAVEKIPGVSSVSTDMSAHTVAVRLEDGEASIDVVIKALGAVGFSVPNFSETD